MFPAGELIKAGDLKENYVLISRSRVGTDRKYPNGGGCTSGARSAELSQCSSWTRNSSLGRGTGAGGDVLLWVWSHGRTLLQRTSTHILR